MLGGNHIHGVPGPIAGADLPITAVGCGMYLLIRRQRNSRFKFALKQRASWEPLGPERLPWAELGESF
jgi:hypothetical protein